MLQTKLNTVNRICLEANELNTSGFYLFRIISEQYYTEWVFYKGYEDISSRFVEFELDLPNDANITDAGDYTYYVYNGDNVSLDYNNFITLEVGKLRVD